MIQIFFTTSQAWMSPRCVFILLTWALPLGKFPLQQHNSPKNWIVSASPEVKDTRNQFESGTLFTVWKKKKPIDLQENSIKSHTHDSSVCHHTPHILLLLVSVTHRERSLFFTGLLMITFLESASFKGRGRVTTDNRGIFPQEPCLNMMPREAVIAAEMCLRLCSSQTNVADWEVLCLEVAGIRLRNEVALTSPVDNGHLGLWNGPLRAIWSSHGEHTNRD